MKKITINQLINTGTITKGGKAETRQKMPNIHSQPEAPQQSQTFNLHIDKSKSVKYIETPYNP